MDAGYTTAPCNFVILILNMVMTYTLQDVHIEEYNDARDSISLI